MYLLRKVILSIYSKEDITREWEHFKKSEYDSDYIAKEKMYKVVLLESCYGRQKISEVVWSESEYETNMERGYFI